MIEHLAYITSRGSPNPEPVTTWINAQEIAFNTANSRVFIAAEERVQGSLNLVCGPAATQRVILVQEARRDLH